MTHRLTCIQFQVKDGKNSKLTHSNLSIKMFLFYWTNARKGETYKMIGHTKIFIFQPIVKSWQLQFRGCADRAHKRGVNQQVALCTLPPTLVLKKGIVEFRPLFCNSFCECDARVTWTWDLFELTPRMLSLSFTMCICFLWAVQGGADDVHERGLHTVAELDVRVGTSNFLGCTLH